MEFRGALGNGRTVGGGMDEGGDRPTSIGSWSQINVMPAGPSSLDVRRLARGDLLRMYWWHRDQAW